MRIAAEVRAQEIINRVRKDGSFVVEVGVFDGRMSQFLLKRSPFMQLLMVDVWAYTNSDQYRGTGDPLAHASQGEHYKHMIEAMERTAFAGRRAMQLRALSHEAAMLVEPFTADLVFIDADHSYEGTKQDIDAWQDAVRKGCYLGGHDYRTDKPGYGVQRAVDEYVAENNLTLELGDNFTWFVRL